MQASGLWRAVSRLTTGRKGPSIFAFFALAANAQNTFQFPGEPVTLLDALRATLANQPNIRIQEKQLAISEGVLQQERGVFDIYSTVDSSQNRFYNPLTQQQQSTAAQSGLGESAQTTFASTINGQVQREFRSGISIGPVATFNRTDDNLLNRLGLNQSNIAFQVTVPLLRGRGREAVAAHETSAAFNVDATLLDLNQVIAQSLTNTAIQYWSVAAAALNLQIAIGSEQRGLAYQSDVEALIQANRVARGEINQLQANLAQRAAARIGAEQQLLLSRQNLALAMGWSASQVVTFPDATEPLPVWSGATLPLLDQDVMRTFIDRASDRRPDLLAASRRQRAAGVLVPAARNALRPQLDLILRTGYAGLLEGSNYVRIFGSPFNNAAGPDISGSVRYSLPWRNDTAKGILKQAEANADQAAVRQFDVARNVASSVITGMISVVDTLARLEKARQGVESYRLALDIEREKFKLGLNSLVDVLIIEDRLTSALGVENEARLEYAISIANLRLATGTIVEPNQRFQTVDRDTFVVLPFDWGRK